jgi:ribulose-bisphosphate carboxylase large chain
MRDDYIEKTVVVIYFTRLGFFTRCNASSFWWYSRMAPALVEIFGDDACLQFGGGTLGHRGNAQVLQQTV